MKDDGDGETTTESSPKQLQGVGGHYFPAGSRRKKKKKQSSLNRDQSGGQQHQQHPLMDEQILEHLFDIMCKIKYMEPEQTLNSCRLICKQWYNLSLPFWRQFGPPIVIKGNGRFHKFIEECHLLNSPSPSSSCGDIVGIKGYPKFVLRPRLDFKEDKYHSQLFQVFWNSCGGWMTHLTLQNFVFPDVVTFQNIVLCKHTPNLQYLEVEVVGVKGAKYSPNLPVLGVEGKHGNLIELRISLSERLASEPFPFPLIWKILFGRYPNLKHFAIGCNLHNAITSLQEEIIRAIMEIRNGDTDKLALKSLNWFWNKHHKEYHDPFYHRPVLSKSTLELFQQAQLSMLETFKFEFEFESSGEIMSVPDFLRALLSPTGTLKTLEFFSSPLFANNYPFRGINNLTLSSLKSLTLSGFPVQNLLFLKELPNLASLRLWGTLAKECEYAHYTETLMSSTNNHADMEGVTFPSLSEFCCNYGVQWTSEDINLLRKWTPNLIHLEMSLDNTTFPLICQCWPQLETLSVYRTGVGDKGILGLTRKRAISGDVRESFFKPPNITILKELTSFTMENLGIRRSQLGAKHFTKDAVIHGFLKLPKLEKLVIKMTSISAEVEDAIRKEIPHLANILIGDGDD